MYWYLQCTIRMAYYSGQVAMHRLSWQRVWLISAPGEGIKVTGLAWRPDSKVLAVSYTSGECCSAMSYYRP